MAKEEVGIDNESTAMLDGDVKKGKTRKFILIYKGAQIRRLIVFKKGPYNTRIQAAKKEGYRGETVCGVVRGKGINLNFLLPGNQEVANAMKGASTVESEPTKIQKLREFLVDNGLKRKPTYEIIRDAAEINDPEGDEEASDAPAKAKQASGQAPTTDEAAGDPKIVAKVAKVKAAVVPRLKKAAAANPEAKEKIKTLLTEATDLEKRQSFGDALGKFKELVEIVKEALTGTTEPTETPVDEPEDAPDTAAKQKYEADLPGAEAKVAEIESHEQRDSLGTQIAELQGYLSDAKEHAANEAYVEANAELKKLGDAFPGIKDLAEQLVQEVNWLDGLEDKLDDVRDAMAQHQGREGTNATVAEIEGKIAQMREKLTRADVGAAYDTIFFDVKAKIEGLRKQAHAFGDFVGLRENGLLHAQALEEHPQAAAVTAEIAAIKQKVEQANEKWNAGDHDAARALLNTIAGDYETAKTKADGSAKTAYDALRTAVQEKLTELDTPENQTHISADLEAIKTQMTRIEKVANTKQYGEAMTGLEQARTACEAAETKLVRLVEEGAALDAAKGAVDGMEGEPTEAIERVQKLHDQLARHPQEPVITEDLSEIQIQIDRAKELVA